VQKQIIITIDNIDYFVKLDIKLLNYMAIKEPILHRIGNKEHYDYNIKQKVLTNIENIFDNMAV